MLPQFANTVKSSFFFWAQNSLLNYGQAYKTVTTPFFYLKDERLGSSYVSYSSPFKQWIYDASVSGATICNTVYTKNYSISNNVSGVQFDYENGRIILPSSFGTGLSLTGTYSFKELNFYISNESEEKLLIENKAYLNSRFGNFNNTPIPPYSEVNPAIYINILSEKSDPIALGGLDNSVISLSAVIMTETNDLLESVLSFFIDRDKCSIPEIPINEDPINEFGNVKTSLFPSGYNFNTVLNEKNLPGSLLFIDEINGSKVEGTTSNGENIFKGILDIQISKFRNPRLF